MLKIKKPLSSKPRTILLSLLGLSLFATAVILYPHINNLWQTQDVEAAGEVNIYYSVGQNTLDHKTGSPTITISGNTATFSIPQTATNIGVGDQISYGNASATTTAYISAKVSSTTWSVITRIGGQPTATTTATVLKIAHAFSSLNAAVGDYDPGASNSSHLNSTSTVSGNYILNIPCYYDSGPGTTAVVINDWMTSANNYIRIYTPTNTSSEVNLTQRHNGTWSVNKYMISLNNSGWNRAPIRIDTSLNTWVRIDGLQLLESSNDQSSIAVFWDDGGKARISNSILRGGTSTYKPKGVSQGGNNNADAYIFNNIIYDVTRGISFGISSGKGYAYNNTIQNCDTGIYAANSNYQIAINNLVKLCTTSFSGTFAVGTDYNSTDNPSMGYIVTGTGNLNDRVSQSYSFVNESGDDFHLTSSDSGARNHGLSNPGSGLFSNDVDGEARIGAWDIGADEYTFLSIPNISGISTSTTATTATITWSTDQLSTSSVRYGLTNSYGAASSSNSSVYTHSIVIRGLSEYTPYYFRVESTNDFGTATSSDHQFRTLEVTPPIVTAFP